MITTLAPMVNPNICESPYLLKIFDFLKDEIDDSYHFIIARTNNSTEIDQFEKCIKGDKKNILFLLSDEAGIIPPFIDQLHMVFRTYSNKNLYDDKKIFAIPCGYSCGYDGYFGNSNWLYTNMEKHKKPLIEREYDIFYSAQISPNRSECIKNLNKIKDKFKSIVNITNGFAQGFKLEEYYNYMSNSKICIVPNGVVVPESFRYFESFENNCIVITTFPRYIDKYNNWFYDKSPAIFLKEWGELTDNLIKNLLTEENLNKYEIENKKYFNNSISINAITNYILQKINKIKINENNI